MFYLENIKNCHLCGKKFYDKYPHCEKCVLYGSYLFLISVTGVQLGFYLDNIPYILHYNATEDNFFICKLPISENKEIEFQMPNEKLIFSKENLEKIISKYLKLKSFT